MEHEHYHPSHFYPEERFLNSDNHIERTYSSEDGFYQKSLGRHYDNIYYEQYQEEPIQNQHYNTDSQFSQNSFHNNRRIIIKI